MTRFVADAENNQVTIDGTTYDMTVTSEVETAKLIMMNKLIRVLERLKRG